MLPQILMIQISDTFFDDFLRFLIENARRDTALRAPPHNDWNRDLYSTDSYLTSEACSEKTDEFSCDNENIKCQSYRRTP